MHDKRYSKGDLILATEGHDAKAIILITSQPTPVTSRPELEEDFVQNHIDFEDWVEIYATNLVKCQFDRPPSLSQGGALKFLTPRFEYCKQYLFKEIENFKPDIVLTLGESAHKLFFKEIKVLNGNLAGKMKDDFTGKFIEVKLNDIVFNYSPCLHIKTYRVAETYGKQVFDFKDGLNEKLNNAST